MANISILKNGKAKAIKFETLEKICAALDCQPGDLLEWRAQENPEKEERFQKNLVKPPLKCYNIVNK